MTSLRFVGDIPIWLGGLLIVIVAVLAWRYYNRESSNLPGGLKWVLPLLRTTIFALGILILTGPVLHHRQTIGELGKVKIYIDASQSMMTRDRHADPIRKLLISKQLGWLDDSQEIDANLLTNADIAANPSLQTAIRLFDETPRWRRAEIGLLETSNPILSQLRDRHEIEIFTLSGSDSLQQPDINQSSLEYSLNLNQLESDNAFSGVTDLSSGISQSQNGDSISFNDSRDDSPGDSVSLSSKSKVEPSRSAVVLITDGQHNSGPSPLLTAKILGGQGTRFYNLSIGAARGREDLAVVGLEHPQMVFKKDRVRGTIQIVDSMPVGNPFTAQIRQGNEVLWEKKLTTQNIGARTIEFDFEINDLVEQLSDQLSSNFKQNAIPLALEASIAPLAEESEPSNNSRKMYLNAITQGYKILLLDGRSRWETRFIRNAFERDEQWEITTVIAGQGTSEPTLPRGEQNDQFPTTRDELFVFDLIIYGEISAGLFSEQEFKWMNEFVSKRGGGIIFIDGSRGKIDQLNEQNLGNLIPVKRSSDLNRVLPTSLRLTSNGNLQDALKLATDSSANESFWSQLPPPHTFVNAEAAPDAQVLAEVMIDEKAYPAIVTRSYGAGKVLYLSFDETWRWRYKAADTWHQRAWNQLAKFTMPNPYAVSDEFVSIDVGKASYNSDESPEIRIRLKDLDGSPAINATVDAIIWKDNREIGTVNLSADPDSPGVYRAQALPLGIGEYKVSIRASGYNESALSARADFAVLPIDSSEMTESSINEELLKQMASDSSGEYLREEEMARLPELLEPLSNGRIVESETLLWQSYWWFVPMIFLLTAEWILRKRAGLL